jgi:hypothetical protein
MTWGRFVIAMVEHAVEVGELYTAAVAKQERADEALMLAAEVEGRAVWRYVDDAEVAEVAELREASTAMRWGIGDTSSYAPRPGEDPVV